MQDKPHGSAPGAGPVGGRVSVLRPEGPGTFSFWTSRRTGVLRAGWYMSAEHAHVWCVLLPEAGSLTGVFVVAVAVNSARSLDPWTRHDRSSPAPTPGVRVFCPGVQGVCFPSAHAIGTTRRMGLSGCGSSTVLAPQRGEPAFPHDRGAHAARGSCSWWTRMCRSGPCSCLCR